MGARLWLGARWRWGRSGRRWQHTAGKWGCKVRIKFLLLMLAFAVPALISQARSRDYMFRISVVVSSEDGTPLKDAEATLDVSGPVYDCVTPVRTVRRLTDSNGIVLFAYISQKRGVRYRITVRKQSFESQTVSGSAPPDGYHAIHLKKTRGAGASPISEIETSLYLDSGDGSRRSHRPRPRSTRMTATTRWRN